MMNPPIILYELGCDVMAFRTIEDATGYIEPQDYNEYLAYDSTGNLLHLRLKGEYVFLEAAETDNAHRQELERVLVWFLTVISQRKKYSGITADWVIHASLEELIEKTIGLTGG
mgnify:CR=1 FL=1